MGRLDAQVLVEMVTGTGEKATKNISVITIKDYCQIFTRSCLFVRRKLIIQSFVIIYLPRLQLQKYRRY
jgi:hypothetical protein